MNVARLPQLRSSEGAGCDRFLAQMLAAHPPNLNFGLAKPNGDVSCSAVTRRSAVNIADRAYFEKALQTRRFAIGDHQVDRITRLPSISYAYPVQDAGGEFLLSSMPHRA